MFFKNSKKTHDCIKYADSKNYIKNIMCLTLIDANLPAIMCTISVVCIYVWCPMGHPSLTFLCCLKTWIWKKKTYF